MKMGYSKGFYKLAYCVVKPIFALLCPIRVIGREHVPAGGAVLCANHNNAIDPILIALALPKDAGIRFMAKMELFRNFLLKWLFLKLGAFPVNRENNDVAAMKIAMRCLQTGEKLLLFPEGTRVKNEGDVAAKGGAVMFATRTGVPMVPIYCGGREKLFRRSTIVFGEPYSPQSAGRRPTAEENRQFADELLRRIYHLKEQM